MPNISDGIIDAALITYDNTISGLSATNMKDAIDENTSSIAGIGGGTTAVVVAATYTVLNNNTLVLVDYTTTGAVTITLPAGSGHAGTLIIKDRGGNAGTFNITVNPNGAETIDGVSGAGALIIQANYASVTLKFNTTEWSIV